MPLSSVDFSPVPIMAMLFPLTIVFFPFPFVVFPFVLMVVSPCLIMLFKRLVMMFGLSMMVFICESFSVISRVIDGLLTTAEAAASLGISQRQFIRLSVSETGLRRLLVLFSRAKAASYWQTREAYIKLQ